MATLMQEDLADLPPGSRLVVKTDNEFLSGEDVDRISSHVIESWQKGLRVFVLPGGFDLYVVTPDGKVTGTAPQFVVKEQEGEQ